MPCPSSSEPPVTSVILVSFEERVCVVEYARERKPKQRKVIDLVTLPAGGIG